MATLRKTSPFLSLLSSRQEGNADRPRPCSPPGFTPGTRGTPAETEPGPGPALGQGDPPDAHPRARKRGGATFILVQSSSKGILSASSVEFRYLLLNSSPTARRCLANTMLRRVCGCREQRPAECPTPSAPGRRPEPHPHPEAGPRVRGGCRRPGTPSRHSRRSTGDGLLRGSGGDGSPTGKRPDRERPGPPPRAQGEMLGQAPCLGGGARVKRTWLAGGSRQPHS